MELAHPRREQTPQILLKQFQYPRIAAIARGNMIYIRMHFLPQLSDFVPLRNGFYSFRAPTA